MTASERQPALPFVDEHTALLNAPIKHCWAALERYVRKSLLAGHGNLLGPILRTEPSAGFGVDLREPPTHLRLTGRHRFSRYALDFRLTAQGNASVLVAQTYAEFPGLAGQAYRTAVIRSGAHRILMKRMLGAIATKADSPPDKAIS